jgi:Holliday junction resolvase
MNARQIGTRNEMRSIALLERAGYYCVRSHLSAGVFDVIGIGAGDIVLLQVKTRDWPYSEEMKALKAFVAPPNTKKLVHRYRPRIDLPDVKEIA